jgi:hypothetical protein
MSGNVGLQTPDVSPLFEDLGHALATDYFFLREDLTEGQLGVLRRVREFADDEVLPVIGGYWERAELPWTLIHRLGELGIVGGASRDTDAPGLTRSPAAWRIWSSVAATAASGPCSGCSRDWR